MAINKHFDSLIPEVQLGNGVYYVEGDDDLDKVPYEEREIWIIIGPAPDGNPYSVNRVFNNNIRISGIAGVFPDGSLRVNASWTFNQTVSLQNITFIGSELNLNNTGSIVQRCGLATDVNVGDKNIQIVNCQQGSGTITLKSGVSKCIVSNCELGGGGVTDNGSSNLVDDNV